MQSRHEGQPPTNPANPPTTTITDQPSKLSRPAWSVTLSGSHVVHTGVGRRNRGKGKEQGEKTQRQLAVASARNGSLEHSIPTPQVSQGIRMEAPREGASRKYDEF